ncbi:Zinc finger MYND domain-containing protein 12 [Tetrabaena socialis]|uniref:Zinc finger MYND domain-containing protein 12 n=1 Tax=Tetrabaena socialis TaxID=47790 RepID=A0A2J8AIQ1_9CHLO|nr:Zinc finger MYND domain-containing protein 12 [Tetrabaena socialis]|eukprot:PNH12392.1 Zinc finger MYND domain-containing protein 12 [Tetrabaena socialis]
MEHRQETGCFPPMAPATGIMKSQLSRLYGQLYAFQSKHAEALHAFAEDVYYCSLEYGPEDVRTSLGYYNMGKASADLDRAASCNDQVVAIWAAALNAVVLGLVDSGAGRPPPGQLPVGRLQLMEVVDMLADIARSRAAALGSGHVTVGEAHLVTGLALIQLEERERAGEELAAAAATFEGEDTDRLRLVEMAGVMLKALG